MAASTSGVMVPLEVYLRTTYRPDRDWIDGEVRERNMGEQAHSLVQKFLMIYLSAREEQWQIRVLPEQRVQTSAKNYRVPDVCATRSDAAFERILTVAPLLCIEVMSFDDRMSEILERVEDYLAMGVKAVWVVDPRRRRGFVADAGGVVQAADNLTVPGSQVCARLSDIFVYLDKIEARK